MITINSTDYEWIKRTANEIEQGYKKILRLPESAEKGRILGGRKAIEASLIVGTTETTNRAEFDVDTIKTLQEKALEEYAKYKHIWFDYTIDIEKIWEGVDGRGGQEAEVYRGKMVFYGKFLIITKILMTHLNFWIIVLPFIICYSQKQSMNFLDLQKNITDYSLY